MIPVFQNKVLWIDGTGDCWAACIASILEMHMKDMPDLSNLGVKPFEGLDPPKPPPLPESRIWFREWNEWLRERGYQINFRGLSDPPLKYGIAMGVIDKEYAEGHRFEGKQIGHSVVTFGADVVHDPFPHPNGIPLVDISAYAELVPFETVN